MFASISTTIAPFKMIGSGKDHQALLIEVIIW